MDHHSASHSEDVPVGLHSQSLDFVERLFDDFKADPHSVPVDWQKYFASFGNGSALKGSTSKVSAPKAVARLPVAPPKPVAPHREPELKSDVTPPGIINGTNGSDSAARQQRIDQLIRNYRVRGHIMADLDPLDSPRPHPPELDPSYYGFTNADYDRQFVTPAGQGTKRRTLRETLRWLQTTYCRSIGVQFMHIDDHVVREWLQNRMEETENHIALGRDAQLRILERLTQAAVFEQFLETKFTGAKSFSLAGAETLIPLLDLAIEQAGDDGVQEVVLAMAHRGRLNVLANIIGKRPREIFREFQDLEAAGRTGPGDVKYHLGYSSDWTTATGRKVHLSLSFNPSHLEFVSGVALGRMRAKQDRFNDFQRRRGMVILIHGDASFISQGVVQEILNLSELPGYRVGGTLHVVVNNQIGFTTNPHEARSSRYCTDVAKMLQIPIFHVNGEDPEAVAQAVSLSTDFRKEFQRDVVIDMYCYRKRGHNEGDEPTFTQPQLYRAIAAQPSIREGYLRRLLSLGGVTRDEADQIEERCHEQLNAEFKTTQGHDFQLTNATPTGVWTEYHGGPVSEAHDVDTGISRERASELLEIQTQLPPDFHLHRKLERSMKRRREMAAGNEPLDWSAAEAVALASLATEGYRIRISGQDSARGTFSQRHAVLHDVENGETYTPLKHLSEDQAHVDIINSPLSETGVMGFDYGYSLDWPDGLICWEAQFGDFVNAAQVVVDQFVASAEAKWRRLSGLVLLLPHGYEGQGPEHSSARLERFLALCAEDNMQVVYPSTPAQYFHVLRRQMLRSWRKPLVVMTPKSLLRLRECTSSLDEFANGSFRCVIGDVSPPNSIQAADSSAESVKSKRTRAGAKKSRVLLCSGKIYYDLQHRRLEATGEVAAIIRLEQFYPLPVKELRAALKPFAGSASVVWVQEEPKNMGGWNFVRANWDDHFGDFPLSCVARPASASPATGSKTAHEREQKHVIDRAFNQEK